MVVIKQTDHLSSIFWTRQLSVSQTELYTDRPSINDECMFFVKWFHNLKISEFPFNFFEPVVVRFSFGYRVISQGKWLRFQISRCRNNLHWSCWAGICLFCQICFVDRSIHALQYFACLLLSLGFKLCLLGFSGFLFYCCCLNERVFLVASAIDSLFRLVRHARHQRKPRE